MSSNPDPLYLVLSLTLWEALTVSLVPGLAGPFGVQMPDGSVGYVPVYATKEAAEAAQPGKQVIMIKRGSS